MKLERKHAVVLLLISAWTVYSYVNFAQNLYDAWADGEDRTTGYFVAHVVLIVVNLVIAAYLGRLGWRAWRSGGSADRAQDDREGVGA